LSRQERSLGRAEDLVIRRGVNSYPGQIDNVLSGMEGMGSEYQIHLERRHDGRDYMTVKVERERGTEEDPAGQISQRIAHEIKKQIMVSTDVKLVAYGELPRSERKSQRVFDHRYDE
jgi:phenylacetate-CoA ligase